jgi:hypothetical protein
MNWIGRFQLERQLEWLSSSKQKSTSAGEDAGERNPYTLLVEM